MSAHTAINLLPLMAIVTGSIAAMNVISRTGSGVAAMSKEELKNDQGYQITMSMAADLLRRGVITDENYRAFDEKMRQKYRPAIGELFWAKPQK